MNILGATLVDLRLIYNVSIDASTFFMVSIQLGYLLGALVGWSYRWLNRQLVLAFFLVVLAISYALVPHYPTFWVAIVACISNGIGGGAWDSSSGFWMVEMWPVGNAGLLQLMQFMYGCGTALAPLLAAPYVRGEALVENGRNITAQDRVHALAVPYVFCGIGPVIGNESEK